MFDLVPAKIIPGCVELRCQPKVDARGFFVKTFHAGFWAEHGLDFEIAEQYFSLSSPRTLRGMHFQVPPHDHAKLVLCMQAEVIDVLVDLRRNSPAFGKVESFVLSGEKRNMLFIPKGIAHGFYVPGDEALMLYNVSSVYDRDCDKGVKWNSIDFSWPDQNPVVSERDAAHPPLHDFDSPFF